MRRRPIALTSLLLLFLICAGASSAQKSERKPKRQAPYFVGDFNTCDFSQWHTQGLQAAFKIVRTPKVEGKCAAALTIGPWAANGVVKTPSDSAALYLPAATYGTVGRTVWQHFSVQFKPGFRATEGVWNWFVEWHNDQGFERFLGPKLGWEYPNLCWTVRSKKGRMRVAMRILGGSTTAPRTVWVNGPRVRTGHWYDFRVRTAWSPDPRKGGVEWWLDRRRLYSHHAATLYTRPDGTISTVYFVLDNYRLHASWDSTILFDGTRLGPSRSSVRY